jgi:hypothetical protein
MSVCKPSSVRVPKLIQVESYDHVHMLVTTVVGELGFGVGSVEALGRCFPPGMCSLLHRLDLIISRAYWLKVYSTIPWL